MKTRRSRPTIALCFFTFIVFFPLIASGQIKRDGTVGPYASVQPTLDTNTNTIEIKQEYGELSKVNLFHSFSDFNVPEKIIADFTTNFSSSAESPINNVISRVTGGNPSEIFGTLRSSIPNANFWFLNPAGVVFGQNAQIDVDGTFNVGAADSLNFSEGPRLTADTSVPPVLNVSSPVDFGFFDDSTATLTLEVNGSTLALNKGMSLSGADVKVSNATIAPADPDSDSGVVQGGPIRLDAKNTLTIADSVLELNDNGLGTILLAGTDIDVSNSDIKTSITGFDDNSFTSTTSVSGPDIDASGNIRVNAENSILFSDTTVETTTLGETEDGGDIFISAPEVKLLNASTVATNTASSYEGDGGNILINTPVLNMDADSTIQTRTESYGNGGDISLFSPDNFALSGGTVKSSVSEDARGEGGDIRIGFIEDIDSPKEIASTVTVGGGATVLSSTEYVGTCEGCDSDAGQGGDIGIAAEDSVDLSGARVETVTEGSAAGGTVTVQASSVTIQQQSTLLSSTRYEGNAGEDDNYYSPHGGEGGEIFVEAFDELVLSGSDIETETTGDGDGGYVVVRSPDVLIENESSIHSKTAGFAVGGDIDIEPCIECGEDFRFHIKDDSLIKVEGGDAYGGLIDIFRIGSFGSQVAAEDFVSGTPLDPLAGAEDFDFGPGGIVLDGKLTEEEPVQLSGPFFIIDEDMGLTEDGNLFHSFQEFNLATGETATFTGDSFIENIISRVTGGNASSIDGAIISAIPGANFFFINPNGVFFGPNATFNTSGAFYIAAATPLNFPLPPVDEGDSGDQSTLRVSSPGFFGDPTGQVRIQGSQLETPRLLAVVGTGVQVIGGAELTGQSDGRSSSVAIYASEAFTLSDSELTGNVVESEDTSTLTALRVSETPSAVQVSAPVVRLLNESEIQSEAGVSITYTGTAGDPSEFVIQEGTVLATENSGGEVGVLVSGFDTVRSEKLIQSPAVEPPPPPPCPEGCEGNPDEKNVETLDTFDEDIDFALEVAVFDQTYNHIKTACRVRPSGEDRGGFRVVKRRGLPASPEDLLMAYHPDILNADPSVEVAALPPGAQPQLAEQIDADAPQVESARALTEGTRAFRGGDYEKAGQQWARASRLYAALGNQAARGDALRKLAETQQVQGKFTESIGTLKEALKIAKKTRDRVQVASLLTSMGNANIALGDSKTAKNLLTRGLKLAQETDQPALVTTSLNNLGNLYSTEGEYQQAIRIYQQSAEAAKASNQNVQFVKALSNGARAALKAGRRDSVQRLLDGAFKWAGSLEDSSEKAVILIHLAKSYEQLAETSSRHEKHAYLKAYDSLVGAYTVSKNQDEFRARSFALGNLGSLYLKRGRLDEALYVTRVALNSANASNAPEAIYRWLWQEGRILWAMGKRGPALRSYRRAVKILEDTRQESLAQYGSSSAHFHKVVSPVYMDLVDGLVKASAIVKEPAKSQMFLVEARDTLEKFRASELREYFQDECFGESDTKSVSLEGVSETAAVVYPILFADRVDLLVSLPGGIRRFTTPVGQQEVTAEIGKFRQYVERGAEQYAGSSRRLYDWLIRPIEKDLHKAGRDTLVFVPDGPLRSVPMSALNDGDEFLVQKFAVAVTPSLTMTQPEPLDRENVRMLLAGLSEAVQDFSALDSVPQEVANIRSIYGGDVLMNRSFTVNNFGSALQAKEMSIVHIASHGSFTGREKENFLLAYDGKIHMDKLRTFIGPTRTRDNPIELLVLSACETAAGDDRAALGLAGVAIQAGARSALGSLWKISDQGTTELIAEFYQQLKNPNLTKAQALQEAQKKLLASQEFRHPFFWSPFLMINNWL